MHMDNIAPNSQGNQAVVGFDFSQKRGIVLCQCSKAVLILTIGLLVLVTIILIAALILRNM